MQNEILALRIPKIAAQLGQGHTWLSGTVVTVPESEANEVRITVSQNIWSGRNMAESSLQMLECAMKTNTDIYKDVSPTGVRSE